MRYLCKKNFEKLRAGFGFAEQLRLRTGLPSEWPDRVEAGGELSEPAGLGANHRTVPLGDVPHILAGSETALLSRATIHHPLNCFRSWPGRGLRMEKERVETK